MESDNKKKDLKGELKAMLKAERLSRLQKGPKTKKIEKLENEVKNYINQVQQNKKQ